MTPLEIEQRYLAARDVTREAGALARRYYDARAELSIESKGVQDIVTVADREVEDFIVGRLADSFPGDAFLGEERGRTAGRQLWVIDPIDGTSNFVRGIPFWCVSVAFAVDREIEIGIIFDPVADELFAARRGHGATRNGDPIRVSGCKDLAAATVAVGFSYRLPVADHIAVLHRLLDAHCEYRRLGSAALALAQVADGRFDGFWESHLNPWDALAGLLLVREAGGWTNDFLAADGLLAGNEALGCTPDILDDLRAKTGTGPAATDRVS